MAAPSAVKSAEEVSTVAVESVFEVTRNMSPSKAPDLKRTFAELDTSSLAVQPAEAIVTELELTPVTLPSLAPVTAEASSSAGETGVVVQLTPLGLAAIVAVTNPTGSVVALV
ncbi:MAG: hypothetical protein FGM15_04570 [Chthoniobacterales bacterium]|nr:hypothetical protein [Chthoniobacterales bacterium]